MADHLLFLTGRLAEKNLHRVLQDMQPTPFSYEVRQIGISVAALMTGDLIRRRVTDIGLASRIVLPGRCRGDLEALSRHYDVPVVRGPEELKDLPQYFGRKAKSVDLSRTDVTLFAEIVDAPQCSVEQILDRAMRFGADGADVIDLGCLPETPFPHLEESVRALKTAGFKVSVDSMQSDELLRGGRAGADYLLSLHEDTLWMMDEVSSIPVLIPSKPGDLDSLQRAVARVKPTGRPFLADPILDPIHFGFAESLWRYRELRRTHPDIGIMMGVGNLTELTDADTMGINALLFGIVSELRLNAVLATEVSTHARSAIREADAARRMMFAAREESSLPKNFSKAMLALHERRPFPDSAEDIAEVAALVKDPSFRIQVSDAGIHIYNRAGLHQVSDPFDAWPLLKMEHDASHAFYMGVELARAQIAWQLGKRYAQDEGLKWGAALAPETVDETQPKKPGATLSHALRKNR
jgi:dihydropteroate synthase-like protein